MSARPESFEMAGFGVRGGARCAYGACVASCAGDADFLRFFVYRTHMTLDILDMNDNLLTTKVIDGGALARL